MKSIAYCLLSLLSLADFAGAQNWSLSYSTYLGTAGQLQATEAPAVLTVNNSGEACITSPNTPSSTPLLTKLSSNGSLNYTVNTPGAPGFAVAIDAVGDCYVAGVGAITPTAGVFQTTPKSGQFVVKFGPTGGVVYSTYLGGSGTDTPAGLAVDSAGNAYLTGSTNSNDFPTQNAYQVNYGGGSSDAFIAVLNPAASALVYSTYLGGSGQDSGAAIAVDSTGTAYLTGTTLSSNFPTVSPFQSALAGARDAFVAKLDSAGAPTYSTYLGGSGGSQGFGVAADSSGDAYVTGTASAGFPLFNPLQSTTGTAGSAAFVSEFNPVGSALVYSTYFGTNDPSASIAVDTSGQAYITGGLPADIFGPPVVTTVSPIANSPDDVFVSVLSPAGTSIVFSTYLGSVDVGCQNPPCNYQTVSTSIGIDSSGNIYVAGATSSLFPILNAVNGTFIPFTGYFESYPSYALRIAPTAGPVLAFPEDVPMPSTHVGTSSQPAPLLLANASSSGTVNITSIVTTGDFSQTTNCGSAIPAAANCQLMVTFSPTATGLRTGTVTITDDAPGSPQVIQLSGTGLGALVPQVTFTPTSLTFASQPVGTTSSPQVVTLGNTGLATLNIAKISISGDFAETNNCGATVSAGNSCQISVTFTPTTTGIRNGAVSVTDNAAGSPQTVPLSGTGGGVGPNDFVVVPTSGSQTSQTVSAGKVATFNLAITPGASFSGSVNLTCNISPVVTPAPLCSLPNSVNVTAGTAAPFAVMVSTTAPVTTGTVSYHYPGFPPQWRAFAWSGLLLAGGLLGMLNRRRRRALFGSIIVLAFASLVGCGGGNSSSHTTPGTPVGTYTATVTATSGSLNHNMSLTVIVQ
jgi:beta-propeller repeat-containing protein/centrosomal CEP192-like protein/ASPM-SPD-2-Hydin domain-containing protein